MILSEDQERSRDLAKLLRRQSYATFTGDFSIASRKLARDDHPDLILVDAGEHAEKGCKLATALKSSDTGHVPLVLLADSTNAAFRRRCLSAGIDDVLTAPYSDTILLSRLRPLVRFASMYAELQQRAATARSLGIDAGNDAALNTGGDTRRVLITGSGSTELAEIEDALGADFKAQTARDVFAAASMLHQDFFDALVVAIGGNGEEALYLCGQLRNNNRLFNLPVLLIADRGAFDSLDEPYRNGASAVILKPLDEAELHATIETMVRRQKLRMAARERLAAIQAKAGSGEVGGVFGRNFMLAHLDRLTSAAAARRKQLSLVSFQIQNLGWVTRDVSPAAANDLLRQVAEWINSLVRAEDMVARFGEKEFCVILPDTGIEEAEIVAQRISGVILNTQFGVSGSEDGVTVWLQAGCADYIPGDTPASLIERAHRKLR